MNRVINLIVKPNKDDKWNAAAIIDGQFVTLGNFASEEKAQARQDSLTDDDIRRMANSKMRKFNTESWTAFAKTQNKTLSAKYK